MTKTFVSILFYATATKPGFQKPRVSFFKNHRALSFAPLFFSNITPINQQKIFCSATKGAVLAPLDSALDETKLSSAPLDPYTVGRLEKTQEKTSKARDETEVELLTTQVPPQKQKNLKKAIFDPTALKYLNAFMKDRLFYKPFYGVAFPQLYRDYLYYLYLKTNLDLKSKFATSHEFVQTFSATRRAEKLSYVLSKRKFSEYVLWQADQEKKKVEKLRTNQILFQGVGLAIPTTLAYNLPLEKK